MAAAAAGALLSDRDRQCSSGYDEVTYVANQDGRMLRMDECGPGKSFVCNDSCLDAVVGIATLVNVILLGIELDYPSQGFFYVEQACLLIYCIDVVLRIKWRGLRHYFYDKTNVFYFVITVTSICEVWVIPITELLVSHIGKQNHEMLSTFTLTLRGLRILRAFRLLALVKFTRPLYSIVHSMVEAFRRVCWVIMLIVIFLYTFALVFTQLIGRDIVGSEEHQDDDIAGLVAKFDTFGGTFFELFRVLCGDVTDFGIVISARSDNPFIFVAYACFQISTCWLALAVFTAQIVDSTISTSREEVRRSNAEQALRSRTDHGCEVAEGLKSLFQEITDQDGVIDFENFAEFLEDDENCQRLHELAGLTQFQAVGVWDAVHGDGAVLLEDVVEGLRTAAHHDVNHSIVRLDAQLKRVADTILSAPVSPNGSPFPTRQVETPLERQLSGKQDCLDNFERRQRDGFDGLNECLSNLSREIMQMSLNVQAVHAQMSSSQHEGTDRNVEQKLTGEAMRMRQELGELKKEIHGTKSAFTDQPCDVRAMCERLWQLPTSEELREEIRMLHRELDFGDLTQGAADRASVVKSAMADVSCELNTMKSGFAQIQGDVTVLCQCLKGLLEMWGKVEEPNSQSPALVPDPHREPDTTSADSAAAVHALAKYAELEMLRKELVSMQTQHLHTLRKDLKASADAHGELEALRRHLSSFDSSAALASASSSDPVAKDMIYMRPGMLHTHLANLTAAPKQQLPESRSELSTSVGMQTQNMEDAAQSQAAAEADVPNSSDALQQVN